ncbi:MAG: hypothetical protein HY744_23905 [Deltaproteobacteria bacterium]|nr:hypothetical protein [Deltaproteobacteria bacterium]
MCRAATTAVADRAGVALAGSAPKGGNGRGHAIPPAVALATTSGLPAAPQHAGAAGDTAGILREVLARRMGGNGGLRPPCAIDAGLPVARGETVGAGGGNGNGGAAADLAGAAEPGAGTAAQRNIGIRGAAPWVARHAAKHAAELRARNAEPAPPGSARATLRVPAEAERIKSQVAELHQIAGNIRVMRRRLDKHFYEVGELLAGVQCRELYRAKGFGSFESYLDREIDLPRPVALKLVRIAHTFLREAAYDFGYDRLVAAMAALDGEIFQSAPSAPSSRSFSSPSLPVRPPLRFD